jgi:hypothetical protein
MIGARIPTKGLILKALTLFIITMIITISLSVKLLSHNSQQVLLTNKNLSYLSYLDEIKNLIIATQKTRGLSNYYLNGDVGAIMLIHDQRKSMERAIHAIKKLKLHNFKTIDHQYEGLTANLLSLNDTAFEQNSTVLFQNYSFEIDKLLALAASISATAFQNNNKLQFSVNTLLPLTESIGKLRGLGSGLLARGSSTNSEILQMNAFITSIEHLSQVTYNYMQSIKHEDHLKLIPSAYESNRSLTQYIMTTRESVIYPQDSKLTAGFYFPQGTKNISKVITIYKKIYQESKGSLASKMRLLSLKSMAIWVGMLGLIFIQVWLLFKNCSLIQKQSLPVSI